MVSHISQCAGKAVVACAPAKGTAMLIDTGCFANTCSLVHSYHIPPGAWECCKNMPAWAHPSALLATIQSNGFWLMVPCICFLAKSYLNMEPM